MTVRRFISLILSCLLLLCFIMSSAYAEETGEEAYPALVTASDFQGGDGAYSNFDEMLGVMALAGHGIPDGFLFGGDYGDEMDTDTAASEARPYTISHRYSLCGFGGGSEPFPGGDLHPTGNGA